MGRFQEELTKLKGKQIKFQDVTGHSFTGKVREVGSDCVVILVSNPEKGEDSKLYNLTNIVWVQSY